MLELLVWKKYAECTSQRVKRTSGARDLTISFRQLSGPITLKLPDLNIVFYTISFRNVPGRKFLKQPEGQKLLNSRGPAPDCFSAFPVKICSKYENLVFVVTGFGSRALEARIRIWRLTSGVR